MKAHGLALFFDKLYITSDWKSNFKYAEINFDKFLYSAIFIFNITIFPQFSIEEKPLKFNSSKGAQKVCDIL